MKMLLLAHIDSSAHIHSGDVTIIIVAAIITAIVCAFSDKLQKKD